MSKKHVWVFRGQSATSRPKPARPVNADADVRENTRELLDVLRSDSRLLEAVRKEVHRRIQAGDAPGLRVTKTLSPEARIARIAGRESPVERAALAVEQRDGATRSAKSGRLSKGRRRESFENIVGQRT